MRIIRTSSSCVIYIFIKQYMSWYISYEIQLKLWGLPRLPYPVSPTPRYIPMVLPSDTILGCFFFISSFEHFFGGVPSPYHGYPSPVINAHHFHFRGHFEKIRYYQVFRIFGTFPRDGQLFPSSSSSSSV